MSDIRKVSENIFGRISMKKKIILSALVGAIVLSMCSCGNNTQNTEELENQIAALQSQIDEMNKTKKPEIAETEETNAVTTTVETTTTTTAETTATTTVETTTTTTVTEPEPAEIIYSPESDFEYEYNSELGGAVITEYIGSDTIVNIPPTLSGYKVVSIGEYSFLDCRSLCITIPDGVTEIGNGAFQYCDSITSITIPDSVTKIGWFRPS